MANFNYKKSTTTTLKVKGELNAAAGVIMVDDVERSISSLLSDFDGQVMTLTITNKEEEDLPEPMNEE